MNRRWIGVVFIGLVITGLGYFVSFERYEVSEPDDYCGTIVTHGLPLSYYDFRNDKDCTVRIASELKPGAFVINFVFWSGLTGVSYYIGQKFRKKKK